MGESAAEVGTCLTGILPRLEPTERQRIGPWFRKQATVPLSAGVRFAVEEVEGDLPLSWETRDSTESHSL